MKITGCVILYNPEINELLYNISTYIKYINLLIIFDNSTDTINNSKNKAIVESQFNNIIYLTFNENKGIAYALNYAAEYAIERKNEFLLMMDQDSYFPNNCFKNYLEYIKEQDEIALFCPMYPGESINSKQVYTSGSILKLDKFNYVGKFDEKLFIDEVDGDYTYRLLKNGLKIKKVTNINIEHKLGNKISKTIYNKTFYSDNHNALRKYYISRNRIYLMLRRPRLFNVYIKDSIKKFICFIIVENQKMIKAKMIFLGIVHGIIGKMGKYKE